jgi:hypothetical protein
VKRRRSLILPAIVIVAVLGGAGCSMTPTATARSTIEQRLLARSLERALAKIDVSLFTGKRVFVDLAALTPDQTYARTYVSAELRQRGALVVGDATESEVRIQVIAPGLGVDQGETLIGVPATVVPLLGVPIPEIALFKWTRHRGTTELKFYAYDSKDGQPFEVSPSALGRSSYSHFTVLVVLGFTRHDLDETAPPPPDATPPR